MRLLALVVLASTLGISSSRAQSLAGPWIVTGDVYGTTTYLRMNLTQTGDTVSGLFAGRAVQGTATGGRLHLLASEAGGATTEVTATYAPGTITGVAIDTDSSDTAHPRKTTFTAVPIPPRPTRPPQRHEFTPTVFYRQYSPLYPPVLTVAPGDTIHTTTLDAGGVDEHGVRRIRGGNPETGPFYIESAMPGDTLVVHIVHLKINRDYAGTNDDLVQSALDPSLAIMTRDNHSAIRWHLNAEKNLATPANPTPGLAHYSVPLHPMLGCIATAVNPGTAPPGTTDSGFFGGNMDYNEITDGATVYLPVANPGALLYLGDAHALMGDGEINGNALETSMDVEFSVDVLPGKRLGAVRVENATHIITMGLEGNLDDAFRDATSDMAHWLTADYKLTPSEVAQVIGTAAEYLVSEVADRNSGIVLKIRKDLLNNLIRK